MRLQHRNPIMLLFWVFIALKTSLASKKLSPPSMPPNQAFQISSSIIVCSVSGTVSTIDARTGALKGLFNSGGKVVTSNTAFPAKSPTGDSSESMRAVIDQNVNIIPGLDGLIYSLTDAGSLTLLPISAMDAVQTPIASCNEDGDDGDCGMVTGVKKSKVFAIDVEAGSVRWVQSGDGEGGFSRKEGEDEGGGGGGCAFVSLG